MLRSCTALTMLGMLLLTAAGSQAEEAAPAAVLDAVAKNEFTAVKALQPRKVLIYSHCNGFTHGQGIASAKAALSELGKKTGAFEAVISDDLANFETPAIAQFDAIFFNNTTGDLFTGKAFEQSAQRPAKDEEAAATARLRKNLIDYVQGGKGLMGNHGAADCSYGWKEWGEMMGGYFIGHPWGNISVANDDPTHPINAAFQGNGFSFSDEIYTFGKSRAIEFDAYGRNLNRVLLSVDLENSKIAKGPREDNDYGLSWIKKYGQGRTFYCAFGHDQRAFVNAAVLQHMLAGLQFAIGDLKADATPKPKAAR